MKRIFILPALIILLLLMGAEAADISVLEGVWKANGKETLICQGTDPQSENFAQVEQMFSANLPKITLFFDTAKKYMVVDHVEDKKEGEFRVFSQHRNRIILEIGEGKLYFALKKGQDGQEVLIMTSIPLDYDSDVVEKMAFTR